MVDNIPFPDKRYNLILADPPHQFSNYSDEWHKQGERSRWVGKKYPLMTPIEIQNLPVQDISEKDSVLLLWATSPKLHEAFKIIEAWGFKYKTCAFVWVKKNKVANSFFTGMGFYTRQNAEFCLLATKGKGLSRVSRSVPQIVYTPIREHSRKPDEVRERIVDLFGDVPRIELFARQQVDGWTSWGLEVNKFDE